MREEPMFCPGDKAVCVNSTFPDWVVEYFGSPLVEGKVYVIQDVKRCICGRIEVNVGLRNPSNTGQVQCTGCKTIETTTSWNMEQERFAPIDAIEEIEEQIHQALKGQPIVN